MESTPASVAQRMPCAPWAWAATLRPRRWASATMACISSRVYWLACGIVAFGEDAAGGCDLDEVGTVLDVFADLMLDGRDAVGYALAVDVVLVGEKVLVHVAAGDSERGAGDLHVRAGDVAGVDLVAEGDVGEVVGADVADGGEAGFEGDLGVFDSDDGLFGGRHGEFEVGIEVVGHGEVRVHVDEAGHDGVFRQVDFSVAGLLGRGGGGRDGGDAVAGDDDGLRGGLGAGFDVEDVAGADERAGGVLGCVRRGLQFVTE